MGVGGQRHAPAALPPVKTRYPLYRRLGGPQDRSGRVLKISPPIGIRSQDRPARGMSLYRLSYAGPPCFADAVNKVVRSEVVVSLCLCRTNVYERIAGLVICGYLARDG